MSAGPGFEPVAGDPERLTAVARALRDIAGDLAQRRAETDDATARATSTWTGPRALDFRFAASGLARAVAAAVSGVADLAAALDELAVAAGRARDEIVHQEARSRSAYELAEARVAGLPTGDARVEVEREHARGVRRGALAAAHDERSAYDRVAQRVAGRIEEIADEALGAVAPVEAAHRATAWTILDGWLHPCAGVPDLAGTVAGLGSARAAFAWWQTLSPMQQQAVLRQHPEVVGNLDGIPAYARDLANRQRLGPLRAATSEELRARLDVLARQRAEEPSPYARHDAVPVHDDPEVGRLADRLRALTALGAVLSREGRQLLTLDVRSGRRVHAAVAVGDVDAATNVAVFTAGLGSNVQDGIADYDAEMAGLRARAEQASVGDGASTATVAWLGYDAPQVGDVLDGDQSVLSSHLAEHGAVALAGFLRGIDAARPAGVHLVALGHSYGSSTTGYALARGRTGVDDAALFGSPGAGSDTVAGLHVPSGHLYDESAPGDPVVIGVFGLSPRRTPGFRTLSVLAASPPGAAPGGLAAIHGHMHYLDPGTTSQWNLAAVVAGRPDEAVPAPPEEQPEAIEHLF